jgi:hypothetical protein
MQASKASAEYQKINQSFSALAEANRMKKIFISSAQAFVFVPK